MSDRVNAMTTLAAVQDLLTSFSTVSAPEDLENLLLEACGRLGFLYFALVQHVDARLGTKPGIRFHNYPKDWVEWFDRNQLNLTDPVHRASHTRLTGFRWSDVPGMIPLSAQDRHVLNEAQAHGLVDGYTVPAHIPGELMGSCSFALADPVPDPILPAAHLVGQFAFEACRSLCGQRPPATGSGLTTRQLECIMYVGRGKTDAEIAQILGLSHNTVVEHLKHARERYSAAARAVLPVRALWEGALSFADILTR